MMMACCTAEPKPDAPQLVAAVPEVAPVVEAPAPPPPPVVTVAELTPYFASEPLQQAVADFEGGRNEAAAKAFAEGADTLSDPDAARAARFMALLAYHDAGVYDPTAQRLEGMATSGR